MVRYLSKRRQYLEQYARSVPVLDGCHALSQCSNLGGSGRKLWWSGTALDADQNGLHTPSRTPSPTPGQFQCHLDVIRSVIDS